MQRRGKNGKFHMASITQSTQLCGEFVIFLSSEKTKNDDWKLVDWAGIQYLDVLDSVSDLANDSLCILW